MKMLLRAASTAGAVLIWSAFATTLAQVPSQPAEVISAVDVPYPSGSVANGVVVIDVFIDSKGDITRVEVVRDIMSLTAVAASSIKAWKFKPAYVEGRTQASEIRVVFVFRPHVLAAAAPGFVPVLANGDSSPNEKSGYVPAGVVSGPHPQYPINAAALGAVVVEVSVDAHGEIEQVKAIRDLYPFTQFAMSAAKKWKFQAATLNGNPVSSNVAMAFVFSAPAVHDGR